ncbi:MAG: mechanosensitive ion channel family protein [Candidatus Methanoperedens sp.]|nr:mechanosensitive ion channel family protein [Candidatus Methanoperedens sp.]
MVFDISGISTYTIANNSVNDYLISLIIFIVSIVVLRIFKYIILRKLKEIFAKTATEYDDLVVKVIDAFGWPFYVLISTYVAFYFIVIPDGLRTFVYYLIIVLGTYYAIKGVQTLVDYSTHKMIVKKQEEGGDEERGTDTSVIDLLGRLLKSFLWIMATIFIISNLGYNVSTLIAGLGIGGLAIAIALQNILSDIFASFSIYFDKPFQAGDFITFADESGTVKRIGLKSTRIQTLHGEELIVSNKQLIESKVHNHKRMELRRVVFNLGIAYGTPNEKLEKIPVIIKKIIDNIKVIKFDRVHLVKFGDFSLVFEIVYYVKTRDYSKHTDVRHVINMAINEQFSKEGIEIRRN